MRAMRSDRAAGLSGVLAAVLLAAGCAGTPAVPASTTAEPVPASTDLRSPIAELALSLVGVPYRYGGADPREGFDCSGLVYYTYAANGHAVPRTSQGQLKASRQIPLTLAIEGDLVFFRNQQNLSHVGIYLGDGRFVHAPSSGGAVSVASLDAPYYQRHLVAIGRLLP
mgnify:FL=1